MQSQCLSPEASEETTLALTPPDETLTTESESAAGALALKAEQVLPTARAVTDLLARTQRKLRRRKQLKWAFIATFNVMPILFWCCSWMVSGYDAWQAAHMTLWTLLMLGPIVPLFIFIRVCSRTAKIDADELLRVGGKNAIPALLDTIIGGVSKPDNQTYIRALAILLPQLQATDAPLLTRRHRRRLNTLLKSNPLGDSWVNANKELALPLLKAYEQVGDIDALPLVERLADRKPRNERERQIQQAAQVCLPLLRTHIGSLHPKQTLLRPALDTAAPDTLLRPTSSTTPAPKEELLRPVD